MNLREILRSTFWRLLSSFRGLAVPNIMYLVQESLVLESRFLRHLNLFSFVTFSKNNFSERFVKCEYLVWQSLYHWTRQDNVTSWLFQKDVFPTKPLGCSTVAKAHTLYYPWYSWKFEVWCFPGHRSAHIKCKLCPLFLRVHESCIWLWWNAKWACLPKRLRLCLAVLRGFYQQHVRFSWEVGEHTVRK